MISCGQIVEVVDHSYALVLVVSLDNVGGEETKHDIGRPGTVRDAFTNRSAIDANVVEVADCSARQFGYFMLLIAGGLKQSRSHRIEPTIKRFFQGCCPSLRRRNASHR